MRRTALFAAFAAALAVLPAAGPAAAFEVQSGGVLLRENPGLMAAMAGGGRAVPPWMAGRKQEETAALPRPGAPGAQPGGPQGMTQQQLGALLFGGAREAPAKPGAKSAADEARTPRGPFR